MYQLRITIITMHAIWYIALGLFILDRVIKTAFVFWTWSHDVLATSIIDVAFALHTNTGAVFGLPIPILVTTVASFILLLGVAYLITQVQTVKQQLPLLLILAGGLSNFLDRIVYNHVIDYFHVTFLELPSSIFNLADIYIIVGVLLLLFSVQKKEPAQ